MSSHPLLRFLPLLPLFIFLFLFLSFFCLCGYSFAEAQASDGITKHVIEISRNVFYYQKTKIYSFDGKFELMKPHNDSVVDVTFTCRVRVENRSVAFCTNSTKNASMPVELRNRLLMPIENMFQLLLQKRLSVLPPQDGSSFFFDARRGFPVYLEDDDETFYPDRHARLQISNFVVDEQDARRARLEWDRLNAMTRWHNGRITVSHQPYLFDLDWRVFEDYSWPWVSSTVQVDYTTSSSSSSGDGGGGSSSSSSSSPPPAPPGHPNYAFAVDRDAGGILTNSTLLQVSGSDRDMIGQFHRIKMLIDYVHAPTSHFFSASYDHVLGFPTHLHFRDPIFSPGKIEGKQVIEISNVRYGSKPLPKYLTEAEIAGIVLGVLCLVIGVGLCCYYYFCKRNTSSRRGKKGRNPSSIEQVPTSERPDIESQRRVDEHKNSNNNNAIDPPRRQKGREGKSKTKRQQQAEEYEGEEYEMEDQGEGEDDDDDDDDEYELHNTSVFEDDEEEENSRRNRRAIYQFEKMPI